VKEKSTVGSPFFGTFPSDLISKATKDVDIHVRLCTQYNFPHAAVPQITPANSGNFLKVLHGGMFVPALYPNDGNCYMFFKFAIGNGGAESRTVHRRAFYLVTRSADEIPRYELYTKEYSYSILD
jgi:hypothetical protein